MKQTYLAALGSAVEWTSYAKAREGRRGVGLTPPGRPEVGTTIGDSGHTVDDFAVESLAVVSLRLTEWLRGRTC